MERIELFDQYLSGQLSEAGIAEFKKRLDSDEEFAAAFKIYLISVRGICQEAEQANIEFGHAMKSLSKDQLRSIIGQSEKPRAFFRERIMWISSMAAMLVAAIGIGWNLHTSSQEELIMADNHLCDVIYDYAYKPINIPRSNGSSYLDLNTLSVEQIESLIPDMVSRFEADRTDSQEWHIDGITLAMAYLKLHRKSEAIKVLKDMAANSSEPEVYNRLIEQLK